MSHVSILFTLYTLGEGIYINGVGGCQLLSAEVGASVPWDPESPPPLAIVPFSNQYQAFLYKRDMFHTIKHGVGRESCASILLMLAYLTYFDNVGDTKNLPDRLARGYKLFRLWCETEKKSPSLKNFTRANLHFGKATAFPFLGGKGSDVTLVLMFLQFYLQMCLVNPKGDHLRLFKAMQQLVDGTLCFIGIMHSHSVWLPPVCARLMMSQGLKALRAYAFCAKTAMDMNKRLFCMRPKFHYWAHTIFEMRHSLQLCHQFILNPCLYNCEQSEDFIGRVARISRHVSPRLTILRTLQRYGVAFQSRLRRIKRRASKR